MLKISFNHILPAFLILLISAAALFPVFYVRKKDGSRHRNTFFVINLISAVLILAMIFKPEISVRAPFSAREKIAVLLDTSMSMGIGGKDGRTRLEMAKDFIRAEPFLKSCDISFYTAGEKLEKKEEKEIGVELPRQNASFIISALNELNSKTGDMYKAVILCTDGQESRTEDMQVLEKAFNIPVFVLGMGGDLLQDISITAVSTNSPVYTGEFLRAEVDVIQRGFDNSGSKVVLKENGRVIKETEVFFSGPSATAIFEIAGSAQGYKTYEAEVFPGDGEVVKENNRMPFFARVISPKINILYVEGSLRWEYKYLKRHIESTPGLMPVFLVRVGENIFQYAGDEGRDVPADIFSDSRFLEKFSIIILGDISFSSFTALQRKNIRDFCAVKGKGILFLGGENFMEGVRNTELDEVAPLVTGGDEKNIIEERFLPLLTGEGKTLPVFSGREEGFPFISRANSVYSLKKGSVPLVILERGRLPVVLAAVNVSAEGGKSLFVGTDDTWRWEFGSGQDKAAYRFFWGRLIRYLCAPGDYLATGKILPDIIAEKEYCGTGEKVEVAFSYNEGKTGPFEAVLRSPDGKTDVLTLKEMKTFIVTGQEGIYTIEASSGGKTNIKPVIARKEGSEFIDTERNEAVLKQIAELSKGSYVAFEEKDRLKEVMKGKRNYVTRNLSFSQDSGKYAILFLFVILNLGWYLRRQTGI